MRNDTERKRSGALLAALGVAAVALLFVLTAAALLSGRGSAGLLAAGLLGFYILLGLSVLLGVAAALRQRLRELQGGEEEDAKKY